MAFNFRVVFTGICTFVRHKDTNTKKLCVLLPDGTHAEEEGKKALDDQKLEFHQGFLEFDPRDVGASELSRRPFRTIWELERPGGRIHFIFRDTNGEVIDNSNAPAQYGVPVVANNARAVDLTTLVAKGNEGLVTVADWALDAVEPKLSSDTRVLSQVVFDRGIVHGNQPSKVTWVIDHTLGKPMARQKLYHEVVVTVSGVPGSVELWFTPFADNATPEKVLTFTRGIDANTATVRISNFCVNNPLNWDGAGTRPKPDVDFKWHYELLDRDGIKRVLGDGKLPHPTSPQDLNLESKDAREYASSGGDNCYVGFTTPRVFDL